MRFAMERCNIAKTKSMTSLKCKELNGISSTLQNGVRLTIETFYSNDGVVVNWAKSGDIDNNIK